MNLRALAIMVFLAGAAAVAAAGPRDDFSVTRLLQQGTHTELRVGHAATSAGLLADFWDLDSRVVIDRWVLESGYSSLGSDPQAAQRPRSDGRTRRWRMATGFLVEQNTEIKLAYDRLDTERDSATARFALDVTHVRRLQNGMSWSMRGFVAQLQRDSQRGGLAATDAELSAGFSVRDNLGIGARIAIGERDGSGDFTRYAAFADFRLSSRASVGVSYVNERMSEFDFATRALTIGFTYRP